MAKVAAVATEEPEIAAKPAQAAMVAMPSPPRKWPTNELAARNNSRLMPELDTNAPIKQEHRDDAERVVGHRPHRGVTDDLERGIAVDQIGKAGDADEAHRHADRHAQQHQREQRDKSKDGDDVAAHGAHSTGLIWYVPNSFGWKISR